MNQPLKIDRTININTIVAIATFVTMLGGGIYTLQQQAATAQDFRERQEAYNANLDAERRANRAANEAKLDAIVDGQNKLATIISQATYQIAQLQKKDEETDARISRITDSYGERFTEIQNVLATISTQIALQGQSLERIASTPNTRALRQ